MVAKAVAQMRGATMRAVGFRWWSKGGNTKKNRPACTLAACSLMLALLGAGAPAAAEPVEQVRMASGIGFSSFDPVLAIPPTVDYLRPVYDTLVVRRGMDSFLPGLATEWRYAESNTLLTLTLRQGVRFTDGAEFNAQAVKANIERGKSEARSPWSAFYKAIEEVKVLGPYLVELRLAAPNPAFIEYLSTSPGMMVSPKALVDTDSLVFAPVGTGGWVFEPSGSTRGDHYLFKKNEQYWNPAEQPVNTIAVREIVDAAARVNALRSGQVDIAAINPDQADALEKLGFRVAVTSVVMRMLGVWDSGGTVVPALKDRQVRQAIRLAINRKAVLRALFADRGTAGLNFYMKGTQGYSEALSQLESYNVAQAKALMKQAGHADGFDVETVVLAHHGRLAEIISGELAKIGIRLQVTILPDAGSYYAAVKQKKAPIGIFAHQPALALGMYESLMSPKGRYNPFGMDYPELSALADQAARAGDDQATALYAKIFDLMIGEQALYVPIVNMQVLAAMVPHISAGEPTYTDAGLPNPRYLKFTEKK